MKTYFIISFALLTTMSISCRQARVGDEAFRINKQEYKNCDVYQFLDTDSLNKTIVLKQTFNPFGKIQSEIYDNFKESEFDGRADAIYFYLYNDTLLVKETSVNILFGDSTKTIYHYNKQNQLIRREQFSFQKQLKKNVKKGIGSSDRDIITEDDYEKKRSWQKVSEVKFTYNKQGHKISYDATKLHFDSQNKYTWTYDSLGRVLKECSFNNEGLIWVNDYSYYLGGYEVINTWYDYDGSPRHLKEKSWEYWPQKTSICKLNDKGQVIEERKTTEKGELLYIKTIDYNSNGQIEKYVHYDGDRQPKITHLYVYY